MNNDKTTFQWVQLSALSAMNLLITMFTSILPSTLPVVRQQFLLSLTLGVAILTTLSFTVNIFQILTGHLRSTKTKPLLLPIGLIFAAAICSLSILPKSNTSFPLILVLAFISGVGIAITYPEILRAVHSLKAIPPAISTAVFMTGGCIGGTTGQWFSALLVSKFGLAGLHLLFIAPMLCLILTYLLKIRMAVETKTEIAEKNTATIRHLHFWSIMAMAIPAAAATSMLVSLLPTRLNQLGFSLPFGGFSIMIFGFGGAIGVLVWSAIAHKKSEIFASMISLLFAFLFLTVYFILYENKMAVWILFFAGFCAMPIHTLMITMARYASGPGLGQRMGFIVGGTWGAASLIVLASGAIADHIGVAPVLKFTAASYLLSSVLGFLLMYKTANSLKKAETAKSIQSNIIENANDQIQ